MSPQHTVDVQDVTMPRMAWMPERGHPEHKVNSNSMLPLTFYHSTLKAIIRNVKHY